MEKFKIFVSSTSEDLTDHRKAIMELLSHLKQSGIAMEDFGSRPSDGASVSVDEVQNCDVFVGIYGFRYGYAPGGGKSITEMEFDAAFEGGKRCLCYFADKSLAPKAAEQGEESWKQSALAAFKARIDTELVRSTFTTPGDLAARLAADIVLLQDEKLTGYSRRDMMRRWSERGQDLKDKLISRDLHGHRSLVESPLLKPWNRFMRLRNWDEELQSKLLIITDAAKALRDRLKVAGGKLDGGKLEQEFDDLAKTAGDFRCNGNYDALLTRLGELDLTRKINKLGGLIALIESESRKARGHTDGEWTSAHLDNALKLRRNLVEVKNQITKPEFDRCFLVTGSTGSGKTHFLTSLLGSVPGDLVSGTAGAEPLESPGDKNDAPAEGNDPAGGDLSAAGLDMDTEKRIAPGEAGDNQRFFVLPLTETFNEPLGSVIVHHLFAATGLEWRSLREFDRFLESFSWVEQGGSRGGRLKLVVAIDDLQKWFSIRDRYTESRSELENFISDQTELGCINWLLTLHYTSFGEVAENGKAWRRYAYVDRDDECPRDRWSGSYEDQSALDIGGWLSLDDLNEGHEVGFSMLREFLKSERIFEAPALDLLHENKRAMKNLASPFIAWVLLELGGDSSEHPDAKPVDLANLASLNYIEFVKAFWTKRSNEMNSDPLTREELSQALKFVARSLAFGSLDPLEKELERKLSELAGGEGESKPGDFAKHALSVLVRGNLLDRVTVEDPQSPLYVTAKIVMRFETFWEYHLAAQLLAGEASSVSGVESAASKLEQWFGSLNQPQIAEGVFQFLLLLLAKRESLDEAGSEYLLRILRLGLESPRLPHAAVWLAGARAERSFQKILAYLAVENIGQSGRASSLFALMYFLAEACQDVLGARKRIGLLRPYFKAIDANHLSPYFRYFLQKLLRTVNDNEALLGCMVELHGCEAMNITPEIAQLLVNRLFDNSDERGDNVEDNLDVIIGFLQRESQRVRNKQQDRAGKWERHFLREWVLFEFCEELVRRRHIGALDILLARHWYAPKELRIDPKVSREMDREANLALGYWYRRHRGDEREKQSYITKIEQLVDSPGSEYREIAFYLIRHSRPTYGELGVRADREFHEALRKIFLDPNLAHLVNHYFESFQSSLDDFATLDKLRQDKLRRSSQSTKPRGASSSGGRRN
ncbi:MAG TPA: DUF4062 domain-containing protein, partial [Blastocatellia bacterium]|nr:DUF4062 domain-containing protein [Blastocatellia bacterium]